MPSATASTRPDDRARVQQAVARLDALATMMDAAFVIPGTNIRMGLAGLVGLVPVAGDLIGSAVSSYIVWEARQLGVPGWLIARMLLNVAIETGVGAVPILGDMFDILFRANLKNVALLKAYVARRDQGRPRGTFNGVTIDGVAAPAWRT